MKYRSLGASGLTVSEIGFGAWGIGGRTPGATSYGETDDAESRRALRHAYERGVTLFDTANVYGAGRSEELIGDVLAAHRSDVVIASKAGYITWDREPDFSAEAIRASVEGSLRRLRTDYLDLLQLHNPPPGTPQDQPETIEALLRLKDEGLIRAFGISVRGPADAAAFLELPGLASIQLNLNMMDLRALDTGVLQRAASRGVGVIARTPLCFGFLTDGIDRTTSFPPGDHRHAWPPEQIARWIDGAGKLFQAVPSTAEEGRASVALRFCLSFDSVSSVIPGILSAEEAEMNLAASARGQLDPEVVQQIVDLNRTIEFFGSA